MILKSRKLTFVTAMILIVSLLMAGCAAPAPAPAAPATAEPTQAAEPAKVALKAAMLLSGPINDGGWNTDAYKGLMKLKDMGYETVYTENVQQADQESIVRGYAKQGFNLIVGHGFEYGDTLAKVATEFPEAKFLQIGGAATNGTNLASGEFKLGELSYIVAGIAARTTKTNKIGFVGAMEIPTIAAEVDMIMTQVPVINPKATVTAAYTGSWTDINKGKEAALAQINNGVDVIIGIGDACDVGAIQACQEKEGVKFIGWSGDLNELAPELVLTSGVQSVSGIVEGVGKDVMDNKFVAEHKVYGIKEGKAYLGTFSPSIDSAVKEQALKDQEGLKNGSLKIKEYN